MTTLTACVLCGRARRLDDSGLCRNAENPQDPAPRFNACRDLIGHLATRLRGAGRARLRTSQRSVDDAARLLEYAAGEAGVGIDLEIGDSWVLATATGTPPDRPGSPTAPRRVIGGFVVDDLDIGRLHLDLIEAKRKASLYREMAQVEDGWQEAAVEAQAAVKQLTELIDAWEAEHGQG